EPLPLHIDPADLIFNWGAAFGDIDNDGAPDAFFTGGGFTGPSKAALYHNDLKTTGAFTAITAAAGISTAQHNWWGSAFADYDNDGFLDVVATSFDQDATGRDGPLPLYHNRHDNTFED